MATINGTTSNDTMTGTATADTMNGLAGNDTLLGGLGADLLVGGVGDDTYIVNLLRATATTVKLEDTINEAATGGIDTLQLVAAGDLTLTASAAVTLSATLENLDISGVNAVNHINLIGNASSNILTGNGGNNTLNGMAGADTMVGGLGNDVYMVDNVLDVVTENASEGNDTVVYGIKNTGATQTLNIATYANVENLTVTGTGLYNLVGDANDNTLIGNASVNMMTGGNGNDYLDGGIGADTMIGGLGDDRYVVDSASDAVIEASGEGTDTVISSINYTLITDIENAILSGTANLNLTGNAGNNSLVGNNGANTLDGGIGIDTLVGGLGNDTYIVDDEFDAVIEGANQGTDIVRATVSFTLTSNVENLTLLSGDIDGTGNSGVNTLTGSAGENTLDGGAGVDALIGGAGSDTYIVDLLKVTGTTVKLEDNITDTAGTDTLVLRAGNLGLTGAATVTLAATLENLDASGVDAANALVLKGNAANNVITGGAGNDTLDGLVGADTMIGGLGDDTYYIDNLGDVVIEAGVDDDTVVYGIKNTGAAQTLNVASYTNIENLTVTGTGLYNLIGDAEDNTLIGNASANTLTGGDGDDVLSGGLGADSMAGGDGNDSYSVDNTLDTVTELSGEGTSDFVSASINYTLGTNIENGGLAGTANLNLTGNAGANLMLGNDGANTLDGLAGVDTLVGGKGNDTYIVDETTEVISESANQGTDLVRSSVNFTLAANVENLILTAGNINGTGNSSINTLIGSTGDNTLDGGAGADALIGGAGNDTYIVDLLKVTGTTVKLEDTIVDTAGANDTLILRAGNLALTGAATVTLAATLENLDASGVDVANALILKGNTLSNTIIGNDANNTLDGGVGADSMVGGLGDDTYFVDSLSDSVDEANGTTEGIDTVRYGINLAANAAAVTLDITDYASVENLIVTGTGKYNLQGDALGNTLTGNASVNTIWGNGGSDIIDGGVGADTMIGGIGNDSYYVDNAGDVVTELSGEGFDTVFSALNYTLGANIEAAYLLGIGNTNLTGNADHNVLTGNDGANIIDGGAGADDLFGGKGNDTYIVDNIGDVISESLNQGTDLVKSSISYTLIHDLENLTLTGTNAIDGTGNTLANIITGNAANNTLDGGDGVDVLVGGAGDDTYIVNLLKVTATTVKLQDTVTEATNGGSDTLKLVTSGSLGLTGAATYVLATGIENLDASGTGTNLLNFTGSSAANVIIGNDADNKIVGGEGNDKLYGGAGNDSLDGGIGNDLLNGGAGADTLTAGLFATRYQFSAASESNVATFDRVVDFDNGDKISLDGGAGYGFTTNVYTTSVSATIAVIDANGGITNSIVFFTDGTNGYVYVKGSGTGAEDFDGLLVQINGRTTNMSSTDIEQGLTLEQEGVDTTAFTMGDTVAASLSSVSDVDKFTTNTGSAGLLVIDFNSPVANNVIDYKSSYHVSVQNAQGAIVGEWYAAGDRSFVVPVFDADYIVSVNGTTLANYNGGEYSFTTAVQAEETLTLGAPEVAEIESEGDVNGYTINLIAGTAYLFSAEGSDGLVDPKIRIFDPSGREIQVQDDTQSVTEYGSMLDAHRGFIAPVSGTYHVTVEVVHTPASPLKEDAIDADGNLADYISMDKTGEYTLTVREQTVLEDSVIEGPSFNGSDRGDPIVITYSFGTAPNQFITDNASYLDDQVVLNSFKAFSAAQKLVVDALLDYYEQFTNITFQYEAGNGGDLNFAWYKAATPVTELGSGGSWRFDENGDLSYAFDQGLDTKIINAYVELNYPNSMSNPGAVNLNTNEMRGLLLHEIGHSIGLQHTGYYGGFGPQVNNLPLGFDSTQYSQMSYVGPLDSQLFPTTMQLIDIQALQTLYGANTSYNSGNDTYTFNATTEYSQTIWDGGGVDTIDASAQTLNSIIHLQEGSSSSIGIIKVTDIPTAVLQQATIPGEILDQAHNNVTIAFDVVIENAKGGAGNDYISGNNAQNILEGGAGSDILLGLGGNDTLIGGLGADILTGGANTDTFVFDNLLSVDTITDYSPGIGDVIDLASVLSAYDPLSDAISDFVQMTEVGGNTVVSVDANGSTGGSVWTQVVVLEGVTGLATLDDMIANGNLVVSA